MLKAVLFDVDGTLAETERDGHRVSFNQAFARAGLPIEWSVAEYGKWLAVAGGKERIRAYQQAHPEIGELSDEDIARIHEYKVEAYKKLVDEGLISLRPGVKRLILELHSANIALGVSTTTTMDSLDALMERYFGPDWKALFAVFGTAEVADKKKPDPTVYQYCLKTLDISPAEAIAIEDSRNGLLSATRAGAKCLITPSFYSMDEDFSEAVCIADNLGEPESPVKLRFRDGITETGFVTTSLLENLLDR
jgi:beta-phosphoglucomutase-like phosphatase (HAD superfamily)